MGKKKAKKSAGGQGDFRPAAKKSRKSKIFWTLIFILINIAVIFFTAKAEFGNAKSAEKLENVKIDIGLLVPAVLCLVAALVFEFYKYVLMMREMGGKGDWKVARRTVLLGKYYDNITPAAVGGQPFQIFYMRKNSGLKKGAATAVPIFGMIAGQIGFLIIAALCFLLGSYTISNAALIGTACFGLIFYGFWPVAVLMAVFMPKGLTELMNIIVKFLAKIQVVKNKQETMKKMQSEINEAAASVKQILKKRGLFTKTVLCSVLFNGLVAAIPFFVLMAFGGGMDFVPCFVTTVAVTAAVYFIPTPGNAGAAEGTFFVVFSALSAGYVFWAMLIWRFLVYWIYVLMGPVIYLKMGIEKRKTRRRRIQ